MRVMPEGTRLGEDASRQVDASTTPGSARRPSVDRPISPAKRKWPALNRLAPVALLLLSFGVRVHQLGKQGFWFDEAASAVIASKNWLGIVGYARAQPFEHPPLYYLILHVWQIVAGNSEFALRFLSVGFGVAFVALLWHIGRVIGGGKLATLAALTAALSPFQIEQSQEARMYTILACLGALSLLCFLNAVSKDRTRWWGAFATVTAVGLATHYYFALLPLGQAVFLLTHAKTYSRSLKPWAISQVILAAPVMIWLGTSPGPRSALVASLEEWGLGKRLPEVPRLAIDAVLGGWGFAQPDRTAWLATAVVLAFMLIGLLTSGAVLRHRLSYLVSMSHTQALLLTVLVVGLAGALLSPHSIVARYLAFLTPVLCLSMGIGVLSLQRIRTPFLLLGLAIGFGPFLYGLSGFYADTSKGEFGTAARQMLSMIQPGDAIVLNNPDQWPLALYYIPSGIPVYYVPAKRTTLTDAEAEDSMRQILLEHSRIWLGPTSAWTMDPEEKIDRWLQQNAFQAFKRWLPDSSAYAYFFAPVPGMKEHPAKLAGELGLSLERYAMSQTAVGIGEAVQLSITWRLPEQPEQTLVTGLRLLDEDGNIWAERHGVLKGNTDGTLRQGDQLQSRFALYIPPGTPRGKYNVTLSVYLPDEGRNVSFRPAGSSEGLAAVELGQVTVGSVPASTSSAGEADFRTYLPQLTRGEGNGHIILVPPDLASNLAVTFGEHIRLHGFIASPPKGALQQGDRFHVELWWQAEGKPSEDYRLRFQFIDAKGKVVGTTAESPPVRYFPTSLWQPGEYIKSQHEVQVPNDLPRGTYEVRLALEDNKGLAVPAIRRQDRPFPFSLFLAAQDTTSDAVPLLTLTVEERPRQYTASPANPLQVSIGGKVMLIGYDMATTQTRPGDNFVVDLYWKALEPMDRSYTGFVHLLDEAGQLAGQRDSLPQAGAYPTTLWREGEIVRDEYVIPTKPDTPEGTYLLVAGMYDKGSMIRLPILDAKGAPVDDKAPLVRVEIRR